MQQACQQILRSAPLSVVWRLLLSRVSESPGGGGRFHSFCRSTRGREGGGKACKMAHGRIKSCDSSQRGGCSAQT
eukprot:6204423-Pleurochrysis_carterae.AAC.4